MDSILIRGGRLIDPSRNIDGPKDIRLENGLVESVAEPFELAARPADTVIDAQGLWVLPGLIDMHVHLREPGHEYKETIASGTRAAAAGGFTAVVSMPNTSPALDRAEMVAAMLEKAREAGWTRLYPAAAMTRNREGLELAEYEDLRAAGAVAVTDDGSWVPEPKVMRRVLDYASAIGLLPLSHAEDRGLSKGGQINEGRVSTRLGLAGIPAQSEIMAVKRDIEMVGLTGKPLHICHLSTKGALEAVREAKSRGWPVSCETAPHYLFLTDEDVGAYDTNAKMNPPLRSDEDRAALLEGLSDGAIDAIATDHAPHSILDKEIEFADAAFGIIGLESSLPLMLELTVSGQISPRRLVELMSLTPASLLRLPLGTLKPGSPADVTLVDPERRFVLRPEDSFSLSRNSPFWGRAMTGRSVGTVVGGRLVWSEARLVR